MDATEFVKARERLGISGTALAYELGLTPHVVAAFEDGSVKVPEKMAREIEWRVAALDRHEALEASGLPSCSWLRQWEDAPVPSRSKDAVKHFQGLEAHMAACPTCGARAQFVQERFGPMPERPIPGWQGALASILKQIERLPSAARPGAWGALFFLAWSTVRVVLSLPELMQSPGLWIAALAGMAASAAIGFLVGSAYGAVRWAWSNYKRNSAES